MRCSGEDDSDSGEVTTTVPTISFNDETVEYKSSCFIAWDVGGQNKIRGRAALRYYNNQRTYDPFCVVDSNDRERIVDAKEDCRGSTGAVHCQVR